MRDYLMSLAGGLVVGVIFFVVHLPLPAPPLPGIFGMLGIWLGGEIMDYFFENRKAKHQDKGIV